MPSYSGVWNLSAQMQAVAAGDWTAPPDAPTSVVATGGNTQASVAFTAPTYTGNPAGVTGYTVTSSPGGFTGTGASSPITVTGLTNGVSYTFTVTATGASGVSVPSAPSNSVIPQLSIGDAFGGGFYAGKISTAGNGVADYYLIVGPVASAQSTLQWKTSDTSTAGTDSFINGPANSAAMNNSNHPAAQFCEGLTIGGYSDWYMPARNELEICYYNLKPSTTANYTGAGSNTNAVPSRPDNYTSGDPPQTAALIFKSGGVEQYSEASCWSSTQLNAEGAGDIVFSDGDQFNRFKTNSRNVRAVRRVPV